MANNPTASDIVNALNRLAYVSFMKDAKTLGYVSSKQNVPVKVSPQSISHNLRKLLKSLIKEDVSISKFRSAFRWHVEVLQKQEYGDSDFREYISNNDMMKKHFHTQSNNFDGLFRCSLELFSLQRHSGQRYLEYNQGFVTELKSYMDKITKLKELLPSLYNQFVEKEAKFKKQLQERYIAIANKKKGMNDIRSASA
ncbi:MAG: hypothetical protein A2231_11400 [Candidatus Firestonebacteria bacterium RIFOXYA2_FULL_40_8]|nr:MAG: hypothetical protein A2231_11400 [Candidatus Firestonebacteria bacterium RIFOXYA2_FULL_40_8]